MSDHKFTLRKYRLGDERELVPLYNKVFNANRTLADWQWKFKQNPGGFLIIVAINKDGKIVGQYCLQINKGFYVGKNYIFLDSVDTALLKEYRNQGFIKKAIKFLPNMPYLHYGFPGILSINAYGPYCDDIIKVGVFTKKKNWVDLFYVFNLWQKDPDIESREAAENDAFLIDQFWEKKKHELKISLVRNWSYLKWRFITSPNKNCIFIIINQGKMIGYFAIYSKNKICYISDILVLNNQLTKTMVREIERICLKNYHPKEIQIMSNDQKLIKIFYRFGYRKSFDIDAHYHNHIEPDKPVNRYATFADIDMF